MYRKINYSDHLEKELGETLHDLNTDFIHESEIGNSNNGIDFYLPGFDVYIEVKQYYSNRISKQCEKVEEIIVIQGKKSLSLFIQVLKTKL